MSFSYVQSTYGSNSSYTKYKDYLEEQRKLDPQTAVKKKEELQMTITMRKAGICFFSSLLCPVTTLYHTGCWCCIDSCQKDRPTANGEYYPFRLPLHTKLAHGAIWAKEGEFLLDEGDNYGPTFRTILCIPPYSNKCSLYCCSILNPGFTCSPPCEVCCQNSTGGDGCYCDGDYLTSPERQTMQADFGENLFPSLTEKRMEERTRQLTTIREKAKQMRNNEWLDHCRSENIAEQVRKERERRTVYVNW